MRRRTSSTRASRRGLEIGDRNVFREFTTMNRGTAQGGGVTTIGSDNLFMAYTHVAHDCVVGSNAASWPTTRRSAGTCSSATGSSWAAIRGMHQFTKVGAHAFIGNNAAVTRDVPPYVMAVGTPAGAAFHQLRRPQAARLHARADPQSQERLPRAVPLRPEARRRGGRSCSRAWRRSPSSRSSSTSSASPRAASFVEHERALRIALVAGEASGDTLGAALIEALRRRFPTPSSLGVAGPKMRAAGCTAWHDIDELAVMGLTEVLTHLPRLHAPARRSLRRQILDWRPDVFIGVDFKEFNLGLAKLLKRAGPTTVQYVSPQVWAWRQGRVRTIGASVDLVLCLFPFEPAFYREHGVRAAFVGHPLADQIPLRGRSRRGACRARASTPATRARGVAGQPPRAKSSGWRRFRRRRRVVSRPIPGLVCIAPMVTPALRDAVRARVARSSRPRLRSRLLDGQARLALAAADVVLVASGTATLETPCPNGRWSSPTSWARSPRSCCAARAREGQHFSQPNLLAGKELRSGILPGGRTRRILARRSARWLDASGRRWPSCRGIPSRADPCAGCAATAPTRGRGNRRRCSASPDARAPHEAARLALRVSPASMRPGAARSRARWWPRRSSSNPARPIRGLADSKVLEPEERERLALLIRERALCYAVAWADAEEIDSINILQATMLAMRRALVRACRCAARRCTSMAIAARAPTASDLECLFEAVIKGDASVPSISAASILAKTTRDALMRDLDDRYPGFRCRATRDIRRVTRRALNSLGRARASTQLLAGARCDRRSIPARWRTLAGAAIDLLAAARRCGECPRILILAGNTARSCVNSRAMQTAYSPPPAHRFLVAGQCGAIRSSWNASQLGMPAVAVTDQNNLFAMVKFYREGLKHGRQAHHRRGRVAARAASARRRPASRCSARTRADIRTSPIS